MKKKTSKNILLIIMGVLILVEIVIGILTVTEARIFVNIINLIPLIFIALYGFWFYKKPHGNMLKYAMLILAALQIFLYLSSIRKYNTFYRDAITVFALCILVYVAGRLNRIEQNRYLLPISFVIQLISVICDVISFPEQLSFAYRCSWFSTPMITLTIMIAYFVRYKEHKEAGLADAPKK